MARTATLPAPARALGTLGVIVASAAFGVGLAAVAAGFDDRGPIALVAIPLVPMLLLAVFRDPRLGPMLVFATFPLGNIELETLPLGLQIVELTVISVAVVMALRRLASGEVPLPWVSPLWWLLALVTWMLISLSAALDQSLAISELARMAGGILVVLVVIAAAHNTRDLRSVIGGALIIASLVVAYSLRTMGPMRAQLGGARVEGRVEGIFTSPNQFGAFCALFLFVAVGLALGARSRTARRGSLVAVVLLLLGLVLSLSRGAWIGTALATAFLAISLPQARRAAIGFGVPLAIAAVVASSSLPNQPQVAIIQRRLESLTVRSPYDARSEIWAEAVREIREEPLVGQGPGSFPVASARSGSESATVYALHAHNIVLNWAAESGIPAALLLIGFMLSLAGTARAATRRALAADDHRQRALIAGLSAALLTIVGQGFVDYPWGNPVVFLAIGSVVGMLLSTRYRVRSDDADDADEAAS